MTDAREIADRVARAVTQTIFGHERITRLLTGAMFIGGHVLLEGPPGVAKTLLCRVMARALGLEFKRIQFTPDLMPSDVTGVSVYDQRSAAFRFVSGPVFTDILLADEINRTPPKTQSALLEAMQERSVTVDGEQKRLSELFFVIATQNPIEHEGTFPLPEAQLDRFLFKLSVGYPPLEAERGMIEGFSSGTIGIEEGLHVREGSAGVTREEILSARQAVRQIALAPVVSDYIVRLAHASREHSDVLLGMSPRAGLHVALAAKFAALIEGREYVISDDVQKVFADVCNHRLILKPELFDSQRTVQSIMDEIIARVEVPARVTP